MRSDLFRSRQKLHYAAVPYGHCLIEDTRPVRGVLAGGVPSQQDTTEAGGGTRVCNRLRPGAWSVGAGSKGRKVDLRWTFRLCKDNPLLLARHFALDRG